MTAHRQPAIQDEQCPLLSPTLPGGSPAPDLVDRNFVATPPDQRWVASVEKNSVPYSPRWQPGPGSGRSKLRGNATRSTLGGISREKQCPLLAHPPTRDSKSGKAMSPIRYSIWILCRRRHQYTACGGHRRNHACTMISTRERRPSAHDPDALLSPAW
jgi:hypothetical protein